MRAPSSSASRLAIPSRIRAERRHAGRMNIGVVWLVLGVTALVRFWWGHDRALEIRGLGVWESPPILVRRVARRGPGPVLLMSLAVEVAAALLVLIGLLLFTPLLPQEAVWELGYAVLLLGTGFVSGLSIAIVAISRLKGTR